MRCLGQNKMLLFVLFFLMFSFGLAADLDIDLSGGEKPKVVANSEDTKKEPIKPKGDQSKIKKNDDESSIAQINHVGSPDESLEIIGKALPEPSEDSSDSKIVFKFKNTKLQIKSLIKLGGERISQIRSSMHGTTAWLVVDGRGLKSFKLIKNDNGFALESGSSEEKANETGAKIQANKESHEKNIFSRLIDASIRPTNSGLKLVLTADGPSKYTVRKLTQPERLIIHLNDTKLEISSKVKSFKSDAVEAKQGGLLSIEFRQIRQGFSPMTEILLSILPGTTYQVDRDLNQIVVSLSAPEPVVKDNEKKGNLNQLVSLDVESADINLVVKTLVSEAGFDINFVGGPLNGIVSQKFKNIPFKAALSDLLSPGNYDYDLQGNTLRIGQQAVLKQAKANLPHVTELVTPAGGLNSANLDLMVRQILPTSNAVNSIIDPSRNVIVLNGTSADIDGYKKAIKDLKLDSDSASDKITRVVKLNYADPTSVSTVLKPYISAVGSIQINGNSLVIWETASNMGVLLELIKELDAKPAQVLIESSIIEVDDENDLGIGVNWKGNKTTGDPTFTAGVSQVPSNGVAGILTFGTVRSGLNINATIEAIVTKKKGKVVSRPRVATQSGHPAEIQETENVIITQKTDTTVPNVGIQTTTTFQQVGLPIDLKVTPLITDDGRITTDINASITSQSGPAPPSGPPPTNVQTATTKLTTKNGETIVIGGLVREVSTDQVNGVPLLSSIPIIGGLFQDHEKVNRKQELIIFITPTILED
ncbi:MAG TPA: secretin N-terminal domain-containing protein [bacterium]|nr:secretin N-terminal domain-containing protein [bacterium]